MIDAFALTLRKDPQGRYAVLATDGYINNAAGEKIGEAAGALIAEGYRALIINMEKSTVINSVGISILIEVVEKMQDLNGALSFCCLTRTITKTFTIMGLAQVAELYETEQDAIRAVS